MYSSVYFYKKVSNNSFETHRLVCHVVLAYLKSTKNYLYLQFLGFCLNSTQEEAMQWKKIEKQNFLSFDQTSCFLHHVHIEIPFTVFLKLGTRQLLPQAERIWSLSLSLSLSGYLYLSWQQVLLQRLCLLSTCCQSPFHLHCTACQLYLFCILLFYDVQIQRAAIRKKHISQCSRVRNK